MYLVISGFFGDFFVNEGQRILGDSSLTFEQTPCDRTPYMHENFDPNRKSDPRRY